METDIMSALGRIESKFGDFDARLLAIEKQNENLAKLFSDEEQRASQQAMKFFHTRFTDLSTQLQTGSSSSGFFGKSKGISAGPIAGAGGAAADGESKQKLVRIEKTLDDISAKILGQQGQETSRREISAVQQENTRQAILALEAKIDTANSKLSRLDVKLDGSQQQQLSPTAITTSLEQMVEKKFQELPGLIGSSELRELAPKILQLQTNLDVLLTGENEANALIDRLMPTVAKLQKDVDSIAKQQEANTKKQDEYFSKLTESSEDCYAKASDAKAYGKDTLKVAESIMDKLCKDPELKPVVAERSRNSHARSKANSSSDEEERGSRDPSPESLVASSGKVEHQLVKVLQGLDLIRKEIRRVDVTDLIESRLIPNVFTIRKSLGDFIRFGPPPPPLQQRGRGRGGYQPPGFHYRGGFYNNRHHAPNPIPGTKWTYDEHGNREQPSDDDEEEHETLKRARSKSRSSSRSRSRSKERSSKKSKSRKEAHYSDESDVEGEIQMMESQINKIAGAVEEIQDKMDAWLKYSKRTLVRSDENTESIKAKVTATNSDIASLKDELGKELLELRDILGDMETPRKSAKSDVVDQQVSALLRKVEETVLTKLCEFGGMVESFGSDQSKQVQALAVDIKPIGEKLKRQEEKLKSLKRGVDAYGQTGLQMVTLEKTIESGVKSLLAHQEKTGASNDLFQQIKDIQPKLDDLYVKIFPVLEDIKKSQKRFVELKELAKKEDQDHIQKILDIVEDIKEGDRKVANNSGAVAALPPPQGQQSDSTNLNQVFNALTELKNSITTKDQNSTKHLVDLKGKLHEVIKNQKLLTKLCALVEEIRKNATSDAKTLSQMNTLLQGLKASSSAHENKFSANVKELKETVAGLREPLEKNNDLVAEFSSTQMDGMKELEKLFSASRGANRDAENSSPKKISSQASAEEFTSKNIGKILGLTEKKLLDVAKEQKVMLTELRSHVTDQTGILNQSLKSVEGKIGIGGGGGADTSETASGSRSKRGGGGGSRIGGASSSSELQSIDTLIESFNAIEGKIVASNDEQYVKILEEFVKHNSVSAEILNSVEDMKQLTSSMPNAVHDLVPKIDSLLPKIDSLLPKIEKIETSVVEIPNEFGAVVAALEENMCANLEAKIKDSNQAVMNDLNTKFETMDSRLAVIRKYAKHGPSASDRASLTSADMSFLAPPAASSGTTTVNVGGEAFGELVRNELRLLCDNMPQMTSGALQDVKALVESMQSVIVPLIQEIHATDKKLLDDCAKGIVMEEQFEALADTILKPINEMKPVQERVLGLLLNEITDLLLGQSGGGPGGDGAGGTVKRQQQQHSSHLMPSHLHRVETRLSTGQKDCLQLLKDLKSSQDQISQNLIGGINGAQITSQNPPSPARSTELIKSLGDFLKKVQVAQTDILRQSDESIKYQKSLNDVYTRIVPNLEGLQAMLDARKGQNLESGSLPQLCTDLKQKIGALAELEHRFSAPRSQSCGDLRQLVQMCVTALDRLLKDKSVVGEEENSSVNNRDEELCPEEEATAAAAAESSRASSFQTKYQQFVGSGDGGGGSGDGDHQRSRRTSGHDGGKKRVSSSSSSRGRASARLGPKRSRVNYAESAASDAGDEDDAADDVVVLGSDCGGQEDRSSLSEDEVALSERRKDKMPFAMNPQVRIKKMVSAEAVLDSDESSSSSRPNAAGSSKLIRSNMPPHLKSITSTTEGRNLPTTVSLKPKSTSLSAASAVLTMKKS